MRKVLIAFAAPSAGAGRMQLGLFVSALGVFVLLSPAAAQCLPPALPAPGVVHADHWVSADPADWPMYHHDLRGTRHASGERTLTPANVRGLRVKWRIETAGAVHATPVVAGDVAYVGDASGLFRAIDAATGTLRWAAPVGAPITASALITNRLVVVGDFLGRVYAFARTTGAVRWAAYPNPVGQPSIYGSPVLVTTRDDAGNPLPLIVVGTASSENAFTVVQQQCCVSRGSLAALDPDTGAVVWQTFTISDADWARGASGGGVWTTPAYDPETDTLYFGAGQNYNEPTTDGTDAVWAVRARDGRVVWRNQRHPNDSWNFAYPYDPPNHIDGDIGDSVQLYRLRNGRKVVAAGQKSGFYHVLDAATGEVIDFRQFTPGGLFGGLFADSAFAEGVAYANAHDWRVPSVSWVETVPPPAEGYLVAIRADHGGLKELWRYTRPQTAHLGGVAVANGVVYFHSSRDGALVALDQATGLPLAEVGVGVGINGPAVSNGRLFVGTGDFFQIFSPTARNAVVCLGL